MKVWPRKKICCLPTDIQRIIGVCARRALLLGLVIVFGLAGPIGVKGYVLEGPHVLALMSQAMSGAKALRVEQQVIIEDPTVSETPVELTETLHFIFPGRFRSDAWYEQTNRIHVASYGQTLTVIDDRVVEDQESRFDRYKDLLLHQSRQSLHKTLLEQGVDVSVTSLGRWDDRIAFVIGAHYPDETVSQVWVDKERKLPLRWVTVYDSDPNFGLDSDQGERLEFVYRNWQKRGDVWYPFLIESYYNGELIRLIRVRDIEVNADISADLLNVAYLSTVYPPAEPVAQPLPGPSEVDEVQETIESFQKKFEP